MMANLSSIARPYALAAFEYAQTNQCLSEWQTFLDAAAIMTKQPEMIRLLENPLMASSQILQIYAALLVPLSEPQKNFLHLLSQNNRFLALPDIAQAYTNHKTQVQQSSTVKVVTAVKPSADFQNN